MIESSYQHKTVLLAETVQSLGDVVGKTVVDCTLGGGGHTRLLLAAVGPTGKVVSFDRDLTAIDNARHNFALEIATNQLVLVDQPFSQLKPYLVQHGLFGCVSGLIADIGVSSHQIDSSERGFSFQAEGPLDMRMDQRTGVSAAEFLATASEEELADVLWRLGEEVKSRQIAKLICNFRRSNPIRTTSDLSNLISSARLWPGHSKKNPATKTFQALRIHVNDELGELRTLVDDGFSALSQGGILSIIAFHSLEDRIVKDKFNELCGKSKRASLPKGIPFTEAEIDKMIGRRGNIVGKFPVEPSELEIRLNPRSRSAKLRSILKTSK